MGTEYRTDIKELKKVLIEKDLLTLQKLAEISKIHISVLSDVLNGKRQPTSIVIDKLVLTLDLSPEQAGRIFFSIKLA
ncbi:MAG: helix-turn-helix transcriptional regulator [Fusobacteriaceae bacterium]|jgi:predicted transcriptional regulator|nr:helix-turn-helix transcriptional regulator [Fusobacteriaceae bacterium]